MPKRDQAPLGAPCWIELYTSDPDRTLPFYRALFGWTDEAAGEEFGGYINLAMDGQRIAGCMKNDGQTGVPDTWSVYLATDDVKAVADTAAAQGGQITVPPMPIADLGAMAVLADPGQAAVGAWGMMCCPTPRPWRPASRPTSRAGSTTWRWGPAPSTAAAR
jgi:predicted enzyme related to lactoylglutathione lyase